MGGRSAGLKAGDGQRLAVMVQEQEAAFDFTVEEGGHVMGQQARKRLLETDSREDMGAGRGDLAHTGLASLQGQGFSTLSGRGEAAGAYRPGPGSDGSAGAGRADQPPGHQVPAPAHGAGARSGCTVVAAIHDLNLAAAYCHQLYALKDRVIVGRARPRAPYPFLREVYEVEAEGAHRTGRLPAGVLYRPAYHKNGPQAAPEASFWQPVESQAGCPSST